MGECWGEIVIKNIIEKFRKSKQKKQCNYIRESFALFGYNLYHMDNEELKATVLKSAEVMRECGVSAEVAINGLNNALSYAKCK